MFKILKLATVFSAAALFLPLEAAMSSTTTLEENYSVVAEPQMYPPVCYVETNAGVTLDLEQLCGSNATATNLDNPQNTTTGSEPNPGISVDPATGLPVQQPNTNSPVDPATGLPVQQPNTTTIPGATYPADTPVNTQPNTTIPGQPNTTIPGTTNPATTQPNTTIPGTTNPANTQPNTTIPGQPNTTIPGQPNTTIPGTTNPVNPTGDQQTIPGQTNTDIPSQPNVPQNPAGAPEGLPTNDQGATPNGTTTPATTIIVPGGIVTDQSTTPTTITPDSSSNAPTTIITP